MIILRREAPAHTHYHTHADALKSTASSTNGPRNQAGTMCQDKLHDFLAELPKCEHHMHVEGSLTPELLFALAAKNGVELPTDDPAFASVEALYERYARFSSLDDFLGYYYIGFRVLQTAADFEELAYAYFAKAHAQRVRHAEIFFDPQAHTARGLALATVVEGLAAARRRAEADFPGMSALLVVCFLRHLPAAESEAVFAQVRDAGYFADGTLAGMGMDSSEVPFPPPQFAGLYALAKAAGVRRTAHVCEEGPPAYLPLALEHLDIQRVDHGIRAAEDPEVLARVAAEGLMMTVCPISNVMLRGFPSMAQVPIRKLLDAGVKFSINSDDPAYFGGYIQECYCAVQEAHGLSVEEWAGVARNAVHGSWCDDARKGVLAAEVEAVVARWR